MIETRERHKAAETHERETQGNQRGSHNSKNRQRGRQTERHRGRE
jgi:hypothetical protein